MSNQNPGNPNNLKKSATKVAASLLLLTGFVSFASQTGLTDQLASNLDKYLMPAAQAKNVGTHHIAIVDRQLNQKLVANSLIINDKTAFLVNQVGEKTPAPSGYYKLSDGSILKVKDGQITNLASLQSGTEQKVSARPRWLDINWSQDARRTLRSNNHTDEQVTNLASLQSGTEQKVSARPRWLDIHWSQDARRTLKSKDMNADIQQEVAKLNVRDTLNRIIEA